MLMSKLQTSDGAEWRDDCDFTRPDRAKQRPQLSSELSAGMRFVNESQC